MEIKNDTQLNYILQQFHDAISIHDVIHKTLLELPPKLKDLPEDKKAIEEAVTTVFLRRLIKERDEMIESASAQYTLYKANVSANKGQSSDSTKV